MEVTPQKMSRIKRTGKYEDKTIEMESGDQKEKE